MKSEYDEFLDFCVRVFNTLPFINGICANNDNHDAWYISFDESGRYADAANSTSISYICLYDGISVWIPGLSTDGYVGTSVYYSYTDGVLYTEAFGTDTPAEDVYDYDFSSILKRCSQIKKFSADVHFFENFVIDLDQGLWITCPNGQIAVQPANYF